MALQITLVKTPAKVSVSKTSQTFYKQGGTLGRGEANVWVLPDPDKFLSSCHCEILFDANGYYILDLSTNGTFFNNSPQPLGKGSKSPLNDGDIFEIGEYRFAVKVLADQDFASPSPFAPAADFSKATGDDIFGGELGGAGAFADPFAGPGFLPADFSLGGDSQSLDPLAVLDNARKVPKDNFSRAFDSGFQEAAPDYLFSAAATDHSPSLDQAISWPESSRENLIPEDWGDDFLSPSSTVSPVPAMAVQQVRQVVEPSPVRENLVPKQMPRDQVTNFTQTPPPVTKPQSATQAAPNNRLIAAMGLDAERLSAEQVDEISDMVGELMRETVAGMMQVLRSRASIKNEFRMNVTTIQPVENNPLKFSVGVDEALENMFIKKTNAYKKPVDAFREGFQEIGEHQVAVIAGIRHGFERMMNRFDPEVLEQIFNKQGKGGGVIPGMQKAKYWNGYCDHYAGFVDNMESSFQHLFGGDFVTAYEDQLRKLATARKKNK